MGQLVSTVKRVNKPPPPLLLVSVSFQLPCSGVLALSDRTEPILLNAPLSEPPHKLYPPPPPPAPAPAPPPPHEHHPNSTEDKSGEETVPTIWSHVDLRNQNVRTI